MNNKRQLLSYIRRGIDNILSVEGIDRDGNPFKGGFVSDRPLRQTQKEALEAYRDYLDNPEMPLDKKLKGFFVIPTGIGKTALFIGILRETLKEARAQGHDLNIHIVVPTVNLLHQTKEEFEGFAPNLMDDIGLYGDGKKDISKPISIMTYNAWTDLIESGSIHSGNVDILISDEAHRGTSGRREQNFLESFDGATVSIAFTATYQFDLAKTVENTHENKIYERRLKDAIENGELARYINPIKRAIRAEIPPEHKEALQKEIDERLKARNKEILEEKRSILEEEYGFDIPDEEVEMYWQAKEEEEEEKLENLLSGQKKKRRKRHDNARARAESMLSFEIRKAAWNIEVVNILAEEVDEITGDPLTDNQAGFFVADTKQADKLEELLNNDPRLQRKVAAQGRKGVAVAIHSHMSQGEQDRRMKEYKQGKWLAVIGDEKFKEGFDHPPMKTVFDWEHKSVVDKAQILGRGARKWWNEKKQRWEGLTFIDTVVYFGGRNKEHDETLKSMAWGAVTTAEEILEGELIFDKGMVYGGFDSDNDFDPNAFIAKKQYGFGMNLTPPDINYGTIQASSDHDAHNVYMHIDENEIMDITDDALKVLKDEIEKRYLTTSKIFRAADQTPEGLNGNIVKNWLSGETKTAKRLHWFWLAGQINLHAPYIKLTADRVKKLQDELDHHEISVDEVIENAYFKPEGLTAKQVKSWLSGTAKKAREDYYHWMMKEVRSHPTYIEMHEESRTTLSDQFNSARLTPAMLLGTTKGEVPDGLTSNLIDAWIKGTTATVREDHLLWVNRMLARRPNYVHVTKERKQELQDEINRTGITASVLLQRADKVPVGLSPAVISHWLKPGEKFAKSRQWHWVMESYADIADSAQILARNNPAHNKSKNNNGIRPSP